MINKVDSGIQLQFLRGIEDVLPTTSSLVNELSEVLEISNDSAYRRMRGETLLTIDEIVKLCDHFQISFDAFSRVKTGMVTFNYPQLESTAESFAKYLEGMYKELSLIASAKEGNIVYACQDLPDFHQYYYPDLANFKIFYWMRTILNLPDLNRVKYDAEFKFPELLEIGQSLSEKYFNIPSVEVWTDSTIKSTLKQISFYWESGVFESKEGALRVCAALSKAVEDIENMAEQESKLLFSSETFGEREKDEAQKLIDERKNFKLYVSDIELANNCILVNIGSTQTVSLSHMSFNTMSTKNATYCKKTETWINNIIKKSTLISGVSEKQRFQFFLNINKMIDDLMKKIDEG